MAEKQKTRSDYEVQTKHVGISMPLQLHQEFRATAERQKLSSTALLRKLIVQHLDEMRE